MNERVRPANAADLDELVRLATAAIDEQRSDRGGSIFVRNEARRAPFGEGLLADVESDDAHVLVGTIDDVIVGYAVASRVVLHDGARLAVLRELFVEPGAREVGIGELLADEIVQWATDGGCVGVDSIVLPGNRETKNFYESLGFTARAITVHRSLES